MIRTVIVDDHRMVREGLRAMLSGNDTIEIVGEAADVDGALAAISAHHPDVVLLDVRLASSSGLDACRTILEQHPGLAVVFLTAYEDEQYVFEALRTGARGYVLKKVSEDDLARILRQVMEGETIVDPSLTGRIAMRAAQMRPGQTWPGAELGLTERESQVLHCIVDGMNNKGVAGKLVISEDTVKTHVRSIFRKLRVNDRAQAVSAALREGLFK
jgi:DNA-binding NarL/FixJ family response regulator